ncbi:PREDICTED: haloacid dehalogenase-like hydrolase domain-containing protein At3g48420 isoform X2 [Nelumbo nucifera]|uniref:Haloacid dehalogenase-like hydrolase domain-containing protein At3g48420 isoform X2 n=1 Tax=Nelumbo nucifera TaxID=4432 RepID=A0A1U8AVT7_NELNU|nr:PREDICTED: haloacid dehalogenase-like hydrolase domain-containing protein At3g48420 isoform X2 [Nelumbo nucifera]
METASCSLLYTLRVSTNEISRRAFLHSIPSVSHASVRNSRFHGRNLQFSRCIASNSVSCPRDDTPSKELAVLLEVEGVLMDVYRSCNRQAFNAAFRKLGLDCANWTQPIYLDLLRKAGGNEERMLVLFFNRIGWPTSLPTNEKETFMKSVIREKRNALGEVVMEKTSPLRPGVENFIDDALNEGIPVVILTTYSENGDKISRSIIEKLGDERISNIKIIGKEEVERSLYGQLVFGKGVSSSLDEQLAKEARKAASAEKLRIAEEVASMLKLRVEIGTGTPESLQNIVASLRAGAEYAKVPVQNCVLIAGSHSGVVGAKQIGMPYVILRSRI